MVRGRAERGRRHMTAARTMRIGAWIMLALLAGCTEQEPRRLDSLVEREGRYLDPGSFTPYSGPIVAMYRGTTDVVEMRATLEDGRLHGPYERHYRRGAPFGTGAYREGIWDGPFKSFFEDGGPWRRGSYVDGGLHGPYVVYAEDGSVEGEGVYQTGEPCGTWVLSGDTVVHPACPPR